MDISFVLLHVSTLLTFILLIIMLRLKNKKAFQFVALGLVLVVLLSCAASLAVQYAANYSSAYQELFTYILSSIYGFISVTLFVFGFFYAFPESKLRFIICFLYLIPIAGTLLVWTNDFHHLYFQHYSNIPIEIIKGPFLIAFSYFAYVMVGLGLYFVARYSVKNSGFFSRQSLLIIVGILCPLVVDVFLFMNIFSFPRYYEDISFSIAVLCFMISIFRFGLFSIVPIALQTIVDHISDSYVVVNEKEIIIDYNRTFFENFKSLVSVVRKTSLEEFLEKLDQISFVKYDGFMESFNAAIDTRKSVSFENQYVSSSFDKTFTIEITPVYTHNLFKGTVILLKDITEQRKSFEMIRQTQVMLIESEHMASLGQLVGGIAHNLKTPIMSISGGLVGLSDLIDEYDESVGDDSITAEDHHEIAAEMHVWIGKMKDYTAYMSDIISTVKGQAVQLTASTTDSFSLKELVKRVDILMNHELKRYGCKLSIQCTIPTNMEVKGEINSFVQVINNLIINSIEAYEGKEGVIEFIISKNEDEQMIRFEVKDYGMGMTEDIKNKLFKEMITTKAKNGTGLGLYMSYSTITGRFGGRMWFESVYGMGTSFYIMIPAV